MACPLPWIPPTNHHLNLMTTILIVEFDAFFDPNGRPLGDATFVWDRVLSSIAKLPGWKGTQWGPQNDDKHSVVVVIGA